MSRFLENTARYFSEELYPGLEKVLVLVPNKRTGLFLEKELMKAVPSPFIMPRIKTIEEFIQQHSSLAEGDLLELNLSLYKVFNQHLGIYESFDQFYYWGDMLLKDFNDIDKNLVNAAELFQLMDDLKEVDKQFQYLLPEQIEVIRQFWSSFNPPDLSGEQQNFIDTWKVLNAVYTDFKHKILAEGKAYSGMMFKEVSQKITSLELDLPFEKIAFVGFHILSRSEEKILDFYQKNKKALFFWDVDEYYLDNERSKIKLHEAGSFLRKYIKKYKNAIQPSSFIQSPPNLHFVACPKNTGQALTVKTIIDNHSIAYNEKTAIVLPDESMLIPVLQSVSKPGEAINVTLGYNLKNSTIAGMIDHWLEIFKYKTANKFYYKPVIKFLNNVYIKALYPDETSIFEKAVTDNNLIYIYEDDVKDFPFLKEFLLMDIGSSRDIIHRVKILLEKIYYHFFDHPDPKGSQFFETEILYQGWQAIRKMDDIFSETGIDLQPETMKKLLYKYLNSVSVNFSGEPVLGLQVMGLLESRNLDFDNVFMLNANEGILPATIASGSFIPYHLRSGFSLPTYSNNDSMYAYYVYRLLHHSKDVYFLYNNVADENMKAEPSRYLIQLQLESGLPFTEYHQKIEFSTPQTKPIVIEKTEKILQQLATYYNDDGDNYLTPSALNTYLDCTFKFYLKYIAGIKEMDEITDEIDASTFGNLLHNTMQYVYQIFVEKTGKNILEKEDLPTLFALIDPAIRKAMMEEFSNPKKPRPVDLVGDYYFIYHILQQYAQNIIRMDEQSVPKPIPVLEEKYVFKYAHRHSIRIGGRIDRIDLVDGEVKVVDYKTGKADNKNEFSDIHQLFNRNDKNRKDYIFQIFLYSYLLQQHKYPGKTVIPQLLFIRETYQKDFEAGVFFKHGHTAKVNSIDSFSAGFQHEMDQLLNEFFDPSIPYVQTEVEEKCQYCPYVDICNRKQ